MLACGMRSSESGPYITVRWVFQSLFFLEFEFLATKWWCFKVIIIINKQGQDKTNSEDWEELFGRIIQFQILNIDN